MDAFNTATVRVAMSRRETRPIPENRFVVLTCYSKSKFILELFRVGITAFSRCRRSFIAVLRLTRSISAVAQWLKRSTSPSEPRFGVRKGILPKLLSCTGEVQLYTWPHSSPRNVERPDKETAPCDNSLFLKWPGAVLP